MKYYFTQVNRLSILKPYRNQYLDSLSESQELFLEIQIREGEYYLIKNDDDRSIGYIIFNGKILLEYFHEDDHETILILQKVIQSFSLESCYCKSYDNLLRNTALSIGITANIIGFSFRNYKSQNIKNAQDEISNRFANKNDFDYIWKINEEVFETKDELTDYIDDKKVIIFSKDRKVIGFGIFSPSVVGKLEHDIGMLVAKEFRRKGYATYILKFLADHCLENGWIPTAGCAVDNIGSKKTIIKIGFQNIFPLLEIKF